MPPGSTNQKGPAMKKRSSHVALVLLGAAAFGLAGCTEEKVDAQAFPDLKSCQEAAGLSSSFTAADCAAAFAEAEALHVEAAPRYDSLAVCEEQHGAGACGTEQQAQSGGSGSIFMPLMMGYLLGNMLGGGRGPGSSIMQICGRDGRAGGTGARRSPPGSCQGGQS